MTNVLTQLSDLELSALVASKICHDAIGPVGAINNGLEVLDEDEDEDARTYALDLIRASTHKASAKLQFARFAFGAAGSAGAVIDLNTAEQISRGYVGEEKHSLIWSIPPGHMSKDYVKLLLNLVAISVSALPRGGEISVSMTGEMEQPTFAITCTGANVREPQHLPAMLAGTFEDNLDALTIQAYYTYRLAGAAAMAIQVASTPEAVNITANPA